MRSITPIYAIILQESMPLWIKDGIGIPRGNLVTPSTSYSIRRWSFPGPALHLRRPTIDNIYPNNNGKTVVVVADPTDSIPQRAHHRPLVVKVV
jgi:hypothetical protein